MRMPAYSRSPQRRHSRSRSRGRFDDGSRRRLHSNNRSRSPEHLTDEDLCRLHIADLSSDLSQSELERVFSKFGPIRDTWMAKNPPCFAFIVFKDKNDAQLAVNEMDQRMLGNARIKVSVAKPRNQGRRRRFDPSMRCYQCGQRGHFSRDCEIYSKSAGGVGNSRRRSSRSYSRGRNSRGQDRRRSVSRGRYDRSRSYSRGRRY